MAELKIGLAPNKTSYFDDITNTYITLQNPVQSIVYNENDMDETVARLKNITHALCASVPALVLYEGELPQACIDDFKAKYQKIFYGTRVKNIVENGKVIGTVPVKEALGCGVDSSGREVEPNRAFDRADKVNKKEAKAASAEKAEVFAEEELKASAAKEKKAEEKEAPKKSTSRKKTAKAAAKTEEEK